MAMTNFGTLYFIRRHDCHKCQWTSNPIVWKLVDLPYHKGGGQTHLSGNKSTPVRCPKCNTKLSVTSFQAFPATSARNCLFIFEEALL